MSGKAIAAVGGVVLLIAMLAWGLRDKNEQAIAAGDPAPLPELTDLATGEEASLEDFRGQWVVVNLWSSWCEPCREESPALQAFQDSHPDIAVVGVNLEDASADAKAFVEEFGLTYPQLRASDSRALREDYGAIARPENYLIDPDGNLQVIQRGPVDEEILRERFEPFL